MAELIIPGGDGDNKEKPQIHVDSDWKREAQAERERLAEAERQQADSGQGGADGVPEADMTAIIRMIATQAIMYLGGIPDPETGRAVLIPEYARYHIDLLEVLENKTKGNLSEEESKELGALLHELRLRFVEIMGSVSKAMKEKEAQGQDGGAPPPPSA
jgi:hypothetical protein